MADFDWEGYRNRIERQVEAYTYAKATSECRQLRDADRRFYRTLTILLLVMFPAILGPLRFGIDIAFDTWIQPEYAHLRKFLVAPFLLLYVAMAGFGVWAIFHRRY